MENGLTPQYLSDLIPARVADVSAYNLRNSENYVLIHSHTRSYAESFLPSTIRAWNNLPESVKSGPGRVAQLVGHLTRKSGVLGSKPGLATYFRFSFRSFKKGSCQLLAKVCARSTG